MKKQGKDKTAIKRQKTGRSGVMPPERTRFKKGNPGGPGRPKDTPERKAAKQAIKTFKGWASLKVEELIEKKEFDALLQYQMQNGSDSMLKFMVEHSEGKATQPISGEDGGPIQIVFYNGTDY